MKRRPSTSYQDRLILLEFDRGIAPKRIVVVLNLSSVWIVYHAIKRRKFSRENNLPNTAKGGSLKTK